MLKLPLLNFCIGNRRYHLKADDRSNRKRPLVEILVLLIFPLPTPMGCRRRSEFNEVFVTSSQQIPANSDIGSQGNGLAHQHGNGRLRILVVDDESGITEFIAELLQNDFIVTVAGSATDALRTMQKSVPDIIISDLKMPGQDGLSFLKELSQIAQKVPFILMSGHGDMEIVIEALRLNAFDYLQKPFHDEQLTYIVKRAASHLRLTQALDQARVKMVQSSKMVALGEMAAGVAHQINAPLGAVSLLAEEISLMAKSNALETNQVLMLSDDIVKSVSRISAIVQDLMAFARAGSDEIANPRPIKQVFDIALRLCQERTKNRGISIELCTLAPDWKLNCRVVHIAEALLNLINNSVDAVSSHPEKWVRINCERLETGYLISVTDSGKCPPEAIRKRFFEPFFTTKPAGTGIGLGLSVAKSIVESHCGTLEFDPSSANTRFNIRIPFDFAASKTVKNAA